jgi:dCMP deaminase
MIINAGIRRIVFEEGYPDTLAAEMIDESGIVVEKVQDCGALQEA